MAPGNGPAFGVFATEIIDMITAPLTLNDLKNLRLVCKDAKNRFTGCRDFLHHFDTVVTDLSKASLECFAIFASDPRFSSTVNHLVIVAAVYGPWDPRFQKGIFPARWRKWLEERKQEEADRINFQNDHEVIDTLSSILGQLEQLRTVKLEPGVVMAPGQIMRSKHDGLMELPYLSIRPQASPILKITLSSIIHSGIKIRSFNAFQTHRNVSSIVSDGITTALSQVKAQAGDKTSLESVKEFSLTFGPRTPGYFPNQAAREDEFDSVANLLSMMPQLETLDLHMYNTLSTFSLEPPKIFDAITSKVRLPNLRICSFRGLIATEAAILEFLRNHQDIEILELRYITLVAGTWTSIFSFLTTRGLPKLDFLQLSSLSAKGCMVDLAPASQDLVEKEIPMWRWDDTMFLPYESSEHVHRGIFRREIGSEVLDQGFELQKERYFGVPAPVRNSYWPAFHRDISAEFGVLHNRVYNYAYFHDGASE
ncbi:hypothetical protein OQA88_4429 [Cercophora sp. LCS_1]